MLGSCHKSVMPSLLGMLALLGSWGLVDDTQVVAQVLFPAQLFTPYGSNTTAHASSHTCNASTEFYDESALTCSQCVIANGASTLSNPLLIPDNNARIPGLMTTCTCEPDAIWKARNESTWIPLVACHAATPHSASISQLTSAYVTRIQLSKKKARTAAFSAQRNPVMVVTGDSFICTCPADYQEVGSLSMGIRKCVPKTHINVISSKATLSPAEEMSYSSFLKEETGSSGSVVSISSALLDDIFLAASTGCYFYQSERDLFSCQALGNLCVLQHFDPAAPSCAVFDLIQRSGRSLTVNSINGWFTTLPFLSYRSVASSVLQTPVSMKMSTDTVSSDGSASKLAFILVSYFVNGTLIGFRSLTNELEYCQPEGSMGITDSPSWMRFGVSTVSKYSCDLGILQSSSLVLHELFLVDQSKSDGDDGRYVPVPVKNVNYHDSSGVFVNQDSDTANDFLSHRFFLYDAQTGVSVGETSAKVLQYAETITLTINTQAANPHFIYAPLLTITYVDTQNPRSVPLLFRATYTSNTDGFWSAAKSLFTVGCVVAGCRALLQTFNWYRRSIRNEVVENATWKVLSTLTTYSASIFAPVSFAVMFLMCSYLFMVFRMQSSTVLMLPEVNFDALDNGVDEYYPFRMLLPLSFFCQLVAVFRRVYRQAKLQLFFVDWEKPRATIMDIDLAKPTHAPISVWRVILVVNEWNKLQTARKTSLHLTLVFMLFLLYGCNLRLLALPVPRGQMQYVTISTSAASTEAVDTQLNPYLRFANVSIWWLLIWVGQRLWKWMIYERYIDEPREQLFIDLCTVSKVSCFFLDEMYHGFYLHCRSPHPFADGSMQELVSQLKQEEAGLTAGRHLDSTFPECQTFEVFVTRKWKRKFRNLYALVRGDNSAGGHGSAEGLIQRSFTPKSPPTLPLKSTDLKRQSGTLTTETMVRNAEQLRDFLQAFVENQNDRFRWRIYRAHTCLTRFLDIPPDMSFSKQSLFLPDTNSRFAKASLLLGMENELMLLDLLQPRSVCARNLRAPSSAAFCSSSCR
ncbi:hypothetical protein PF001_g168 [Phytophthora fragariae]|uniref:Transmembrane protein n=1 Tax=Phytophthora fragariae TaxID=53985 RepID=A0A6A3MHT2_9STRA|nr:hypothetical protein PF011_g588 [Phytophthora fragariae]KAE9330790.1 hypothetical protein PF001_g168 [Phytophthora fragariae]